MIEKAIYYERAMYHIKQAEKWLALYSRKQTSTRRIILEHYIDLVRYHIKKNKEELNYEIFKVSI